MRTSSLSSRFVLLLCGLAACGDGVSAGAGGVDDDAGVDAGRDAGLDCERDAQCDDGLFCNGRERCLLGGCVQGELPRCDDGIACTVDRCDEELRSCQHAPPDRDRDGHADASCEDADGVAFGDDCDDGDPTRFPGNLEVCDGAGHDEDCDPQTFGTTDLDGDDFIDARCCNGDVCGRDCDDGRPGVSPTSSETCDRIDNDCDGSIDEEVAVTLYPDADFDGHGEIDAEPVTACAGTPGLSNLADDCDDADPARHPGLPELCDEGRDNDCDPATTDADGQPTEWFRDADGDGFGDATRVKLSCAPIPGYVLLGSDCNDGDPSVQPAAVERCDGIDNDCHAGADFEIAPGDFEDDDQDGALDAMCGGDDCDDRNPNTRGQRTAEVCDGWDNDCDGAVDEDTRSQVYFPDLDGDGFGSLRGAVSGCTPPPGYTDRTGDCDDANAERTPGRAELCDGRDQDCDGAIDESAPDADGDGVCDAVDACDGDDRFGDGDGDGICDDIDPCEGAAGQGDSDRDGVCDDRDQCQGRDDTGDADGDGICEDIDVCFGSNASGDSDGDGLCGNLDGNLCDSALDQPDGTCLLTITANSGAQYGYGTNGSECFPAIAQATPIAGGPIYTVSQVQQAVAMAPFSVTRIALRFPTPSVAIGQLLSMRMRLFETSRQGDDHWVELRGGTQPVFGGSFDQSDFSAATEQLDVGGPRYGVLEMNVPLSQFNGTGPMEFMLTAEDPSCVRPQTGSWVNEWSFHAFNSPQAGARPQLEIRYSPVIALP